MTVTGFDLAGEGRPSRASDWLLMTTHLDRGHELSSGVGLIDGRR